MFQEIVFKTELSFPLTVASTQNSFQFIFHRHLFKDQNDV